MRGKDSTEKVISGPSSRKKIKIKIKIKILLKI
jgi:hypothetical protein